MVSQYPPTSVDDMTIGLLSSAEVDLVRADMAASSSRVSPAIRKNLLRIEAITSARIDGFDVGYRDLLRLEASVAASKRRNENCEHLFLLARKQESPDAHGLVAAYRYMRAIEWVAENIKKGSPVTIETFNKIRSLYDEEEISLVANDPDFCSSVRRISSWRREREEDHFGWNNRREIEDYVAFLSSDVLTPAAQAEISHAMLQMIKPYEGSLDGFERLFTHLLFYRRGLLTQSIAPLAAGPASNIEQHVRSLTSNMAYISKPEPEHRAIQADFNDSAHCTRIAARTMKVVIEAIEYYATKWEAQLGRPKSSSATCMLTRSLLKSGCITVDAACEDTGKSFSAINNAMSALVENGIAAEVGCLSKHRLFLAHDTAVFFEKLISRLSSPDGPNRNELLLEFETALGTEGEGASAEASEDTAKRQV